VLPVAPSRIETKLVAVAGIEPTSLDYQSSALPLSYTAMVDLTRLKLAPHGLKGRCSVTRAPGQKIGCGGRIRTFDGRINSAVPYQLGYATRNFSHEKAPKAHKLILCFVLLCGRTWLRRRDSNSYHLVYKTSALEPIELRRNLVDWEGVKPSREVCRTSMLSVTSPAQNFGGCGWSRTTNLALMRRLLFPVELHSRRYFGSPRRS
jgi:hypothetical protein